MTKFSPVQAPLLSFFSGDLYRDVAKNWHGIGFLYLFVVLSLVWALWVARICVPLVVTAQEQLPYFIGQWPTLTIKAGHLKIDKPCPHKIKDKKGVTIIVFDTTGKYKTPQEAETALLFTETEVVPSAGQDYGPGTPSATPLPLSSMPDAVIGAAELQQMIMMATTVGLPAFLFFFCGLFVLFIHMLQALIYGLITYITSSILEFKLTYGTAVRTAVIAMTPAILISAVISLVDMSGKLAVVWGGLSIFCVIGYIVFACKSIAGQARQDAAAATHAAATDPPTGTQETGSSEPPAPQA